MDFDLRIKALERLAQSQTEPATVALANALDAAATTLRSDTDYERLSQAIRVVATIGHRNSAHALPTLVEFVGGIEARGLTHAPEELELTKRWPHFRSTIALVNEAAEALIELRYFDLPLVLRALLSLAKHADEGIRRVAKKGLGAISEYNIVVFYGHDGSRGAGAYPQRVILDVLEAHTASQMEENISSVVLLLEHLLSPEVQGTAWSADSLTISRGPIPATEDVADVRRRAISLLQRLYLANDSIERRLNLVSHLQSATRTYGEEHSSVEWRRMFVRDALAVLGFFAQICRTTQWPILQQIEHTSYWIFYHAISNEVEEAALAVQREIATNSEYEIYKTLIGFKGVFGDWHDLKKSNRHESDDEWRRERAKEYAFSINEENFSRWRERLNSFAQTRSNDLATFPIFYFFLEVLSAQHPGLALRLLREDAETLERFLIPVLRGLLGTISRQETIDLMSSWIESGNHLYACAKVFESAPQLELDLVKNILEMAKNKRELSVVQEVIAVAIANYRSSNAATVSELFLPSITYLTEQRDAHWVFDAWYRPEMRTLVRSLDIGDVDVVLKNLATINKIDYHVEEILSVIAERDTEAVLNFLCDRLLNAGDQLRIDLEEYEAMPYQVHKLNKPLAANPKLTIEKFKSVYEKIPDHFVYRGAHFLKAVFPDFPFEVEAEFLALVRRGRDVDISFVLAVLRNYEGEPFIHNVCKEILRVRPGDLRFEGRIAIALQNTGVVRGELGLAEAYEQKKASVQSWLADSDENVRGFAQRFIADMDSQISAEIARASDRIAVQKHRYGEG